MRALKVLVAVMGVMIVGGIAVLAAAIAGRLSKGGSAAPAFIAPAIDIPAGGHIEAISTGPDRLVLDVVVGDGTRQLVIIDLASGKKLGTIPLRPAP